MDVASNGAHLSEISACSLELVARILVNAIAIPVANNSVDNRDPPVRKEIHFGLSDTAIRQHRFVLPIRLVHTETPYGSSQPMPSLSLSNRCGSGSRTGKLRC